MKKIILLFSISIILSCATNKKNNTKEIAAIKNVANDTIPKVIGVGGVFFFSENPKETNDWYSKNLGFDVNQWGTAFESRNKKNPDIIERLQWSLFKKGNSYFAPSKKEFMINYRVQNIEGLIKKLRKNGVTIVDELQSVDYGKFIHIMDSEGNKIELWEPIYNEKTK